MSFNCGIVGLPNIGKSTLFNALTQTQSAESANYPFCTIEPNVGKVSVPDDRLGKLAKLANSEKTIYSQIEFIDIAGLVKGASKGDGLGNKFLANIREVDVICHVLRCFEDDNITHVDGKIDPVFDAEIIETELMLADLEAVEKRLSNIDKRIKKGEEIAKKEKELLLIAKEFLDNGKPCRFAKINEEDIKIWKNLFLLTSKPVLYVCNVSEDAIAVGNKFSKSVEEKAKLENAECIIISAAIEAEISLMDEEDQKEFLDDLNLKEKGLNRLIIAGYKLLGQITYFTVGPKEARAWNVKNGASAPNGAGAIHTDFERGFICAEVISYDDYINSGGEAKAKEMGKWRQEGKSYIINDGDVIHFQFNV